MVLSYKVVDAGDICPMQTITVTFVAEVMIDTTPTLVTRIKQASRIPWDDRYDRTARDTLIDPGLPGWPDRPDNCCNPNYVDMPANSFVVVIQTGGISSSPLYPGYQNNRILIYGGSMESAAQATEPTAEIQTVISVPATYCNGVLFDPGSSGPQEVITDPGTPFLVTSDTIEGPQFNWDPLNAGTRRFTSSMHFAANWWHTNTTGSGYGSPHIIGYADYGNICATPPTGATGPIYGNPPALTVHSKVEAATCVGGGGATGSWNNLVNVPSAPGMSGVVITAGSPNITFDDMGSVLLTTEMGIYSDAFPGDRARVVSATSSSAVLSQAAWKDGTSASAFYCTGLFRMQKWNGTANNRYREPHVIRIENPIYTANSRIVKCDSTDEIDAELIPHLQLVYSVGEASEPGPTITRVIDPTTFEVSSLEVPPSIGVGSVTFTEGSSAVLCEDLTYLQAAIDTDLYKPLNTSDFFLEGESPFNAVTGAREVEFQVSGIQGANQLDLASPSTRTFTAPAGYVRLYPKPTDPPTYAYIKGGPVLEGDDPSYPAAPHAHGDVDLGGYTGVAGEDGYMLVVCS